MNIEKKNKIIINFMKKPYMEWQDPAYHCDWNWLMSVVEKIEDIYDSHSPIVHISKSIGGGKHYCDIDNKRYGRGVSVMVYGKTKIDAVYNACVQFIEWYNKQPK